MNLWRWWVFFGCAAFLALCGSAPAVESPRRVLVLHSYHSGLPWTDDIMSGMAEVFSGAAEPVQLHVEYLDTKRYRRPDYLDTILETGLGYKLANLSFDLVLVSDNDAFRYAIRHKRDLFSGIPVVFCGVNGFNPQMLDGLKDVVGIGEWPSFRDTIALAHKLHPRSGKAVFIGADRDLTGVLNRQAIEEVLPEFADHLSFSFWTDLPIEVLEQRIGTLPPETLVFLANAVTDRHGRILPFSEMAERLRSRSKAPLYGFWDFFLDHGIVGGKVVSGRAQGRLAAELALRVLAGEPPEEMGFIAAEANRYIFDYHELGRFQISLLSLPEGSEVINRPVSFYRIHKWKMWVFLGLLVMVVMVLAAVGAWRRQMIQALLASEERLRSIFDTAGAGICTFSPEGKLLQANSALGELLGYDERELQGMEIAGMVHPEDRSEVVALLEEFKEGRSQGFEGERRLLRRDGTGLWAAVTASALFDRSGRPLYGVGLVQDITERVRAQEKLRENESRLNHLAYHDALTNLPNRLLFFDRLQHAMAKARRSGTQVALFFMDLDRFKNINDTLGHETGDRLLCMVGQRIGALLRETDTLARFGGDEFVVILEEIRDVKEAAVVAQKILLTLPRPIQLNENELFVTTSLGISLFPVDSEDAEGLLKCADVAMFRAKEQGRNAYEFYTPDMNARACEFLHMEGSLRRALEKEQFVLHYQPQFNLETGQLTGLEALIRWIHPEQGMISPADFIPIAEETGLIVPIGEWVLRTACLQAREFRNGSGNQVNIAVNLSARQFRQSNLRQVVLQALEDSGIPPKFLELELTESMIMNNVEAAVFTMQELSSLGVTLAIDDFGTGYSSLNYLKRFPIHKLKIDRTFIRDIGSDPNDAVIAGAVIALGRSLNLEVIAEGIETEEQLRFLRAHGCGTGQGYLLGRPLPCEELKVVLRGKLNG